jgi:DegV family protein with EDD domain
MEDKNNKLYKIGDLVNLLGITPRTIRYYEQIGLLPKVKRSPGNVRVFDDNDIEIIKKIRKFQTTSNIPLDSIKDKLLQNIDLEKRKTIIVTDSLVSIPENIRKEIGIKIIPFTIKLGKKEFLDKGTITPASIMEKSEKSGLAPLVSPPEVDDFIAVYKKLSDKGYRRIYSIHSCSKLTKAFANASIASHQVAATIDVIPIDSQTLGPGLGILINKIARSIQNGMTFEEARFHVLKPKASINLYSLSNSMKYMYRAGMYSKEEEKQYQLLLLQLMEFKPIYTFKSNKGIIDIVKLCKDKKEAIKHLLKVIDQEIQYQILHNNNIQNIGISYNHLYGEAIELSNHMKNKYPDANLFLTEGSVALSQFFGPQAMGLSIS